MSILKLPFIVIDVVGMIVSATPPNPPHPFSEHIVPDWREKFLKALAWPCVWLRVMYWAACFTEGLVILANQYPSTQSAQRVVEALNIPNASSQIQITPLFILGISAVVFGTVLRMKCYRTLGTLFTFELCIQQHHTLVVTGPYSVIRHPSYTGLIVTIIGACCIQAHGSWVIECGILSTTIGQVLLLIWLTIASAVILSLVLRIPNEDRLLHEKFGEEWEMWTRVVRYKLVPGVY